MIRYPAYCLLIGLALGALPSAGLAHSVGRSALSLDFEDSEGRASWRIGVRDLDALLGLDADHDRKVSQDELAHASTVVAAYLLDRIELDAGGASCTTGAQQTTLEGAYLRFDFRVACPQAPRSLWLRYDLFFDHDAGHTAQVTFSREGLSVSEVLTADARRLELTLGADDPWQRAREYLRQGVVHIWIGYDHVLFLLTLLLPAVLRRGRAGWEPAPSFAAAFAEVLKIVSAFTLAHSLTLSLAALGVLQFPARWVEATIAASVCLAALNNVYGWVTRCFWIGACSFGLIHGFGFASVLNELGVPQQLLLVALLAFNAGVELGQLAIVAGFLPLAFAVRRSRWYALLGLHAGSLVIAVVGLVWLIERALDLTLDQFAALLREAAFARLWPVWLGAALALGLWSFARLRRVRWLSPLAAIVVIAGAGYALRVANVERAALQRELAGQLAAAREDMQRREWSRTEALLAGAARIAALLGDERAQADALARRGSLDIARAELGAARHAHERALALYDGLGDERACASSQRALGLIAHLAGDTTLAARAYRRALAIHERLGLDALAAGDAAELAAIYQYSNQHTEAQAMTTQARELARRARGLPHTAD